MVSQKCMVFIGPPCTNSANIVHVYCVTNIKPSVHKTSYCMSNFLSGNGNNASSVCVFAKTIDKKSQKTS